MSDQHRGRVALKSAVYALGVILVLLVAGPIGGGFGREGAQALLSWFNSADEESARTSLQSEGAWEERVTAQDLAREMQSYEAAVFELMVANPDKTAAFLAAGADGAEAATAAWSAIVDPAFVEEAVKPIAEIAFQLAKQDSSLDPNALVQQTFFVASCRISFKVTRLGLEADKAAYARLEEEASNFCNQRWALQNSTAAGQEGR